MYNVYEVPIKMTSDRIKLEDFLNNLNGEVVAIIPNVDGAIAGWSSGITFLWIIERVK